MSRLLILRFSAMGDVAMTIPVVYSFARHFPETEIYFVSRSGFSDMFQNPPENFHFVGANLKKDYSGVSGIIRLTRFLMSLRCDEVADLHDVLRTKIACTALKIMGKRVSSIDKGRKEKRRLTASQKKQFRQLPSSFERYHNVFRRLGYDFRLDFKTLYEENQPLSATIEQLIGQKDKQRWVGLAPFAAHKGKAYPLERMEEVVRELSSNEEIRIFLFGGGEYEKALLTKWEERYDRVTSLVGQLRMSDELLVMSKLDVMVSMDSGNMHLASLVGTPVVSIWGATHPYAGFMGWQQDMANVVSVEMTCRPCAVFGNKPCRRGDYACLMNITPKMIICRIMGLLYSREIVAPSGIEPESKV